MTLADRVRAWIDADPDQASRGELQRLLDAGDEAALAERFAGPLTFGTAGLRGPMRAGPSGMNLAVVRRAAAGLAAYLQGTCAQRPAVVIGYDARHQSAQFATDSARVMAAAGLDVSLLPGPLPTPVLAYLVRARGADAGVVVTASHNPPQDNGYKVYLGGREAAAAAGALLIPPQDEQIERAIAAAPPAAEVPLSSELSTLGPEAVDGYLDGVVNLLPTGAREVRVAYTPLHGVGAGTLLAAFERAGFPAPAVVAAQAQPDPEFPTVAFPNPEEPGATDLLLALAAQVDADIGIANDPDGDRCAVAAGGRMLSGDELGLLLADHILTHRADRPGTLVATTVVSSSALPVLARARGATCVTTPTGFKWLVRAGAGESAELVYAYEEALGYAVGLDLVRDKDGISAALMAAELAAVLKAHGKTLIDRLDELACEMGLFSTAHVTARARDASAGERAIRRLLDEPPAALGGVAVRQVHDLNQPEAGRQPTNGVRLELAGGRVVVRPSGTEPKVKAYLELFTPAAVARADLPVARAAAADRLSDIATDLRPLLE